MRISAKTRTRILPFVGHSDRRAAQPQIRELPAPLGNKLNGSVGDSGAAAEVELDQVGTALGQDFYMLAWSPWHSRIKS